MRPPPEPSPEENELRKGRRTTVYLNVNSIFFDGTKKIHQRLGGGGVETEKLPSFFFSLLLSLVPGPPVSWRSNRLPVRPGTWLREEDEPAMMSAGSEQREPAPADVDQNSAPSQKGSRGPRKLPLVQQKRRRAGAESATCSRVVWVRRAPSPEGLRFSRESENEGEKNVISTSVALAVLLFSLFFARFVLFFRLQKQAEEISLSSFFFFFRSRSSR